MPSFMVHSTPPVRTALPSRIFSTLTLYDDLFEKLRDMAGQLPDTVKDFIE